MKGVILVTGAAGFIGSHLTGRLLRLGYRVVGLDNFDSFYDPSIKEANVRPLLKDGCTLIRGDIRDAELLHRVFSEYNFDVVTHLAARAGVRPSIQQPLLYQDVNIGGTINLLEASRASGVSNFVFASSSSVYGLGTPVPFSEEAKIDHPTSPYAASKAAGELFCRTYNHLYGLPVKALRFFTVYGPRQRPEMAIHLFTRMIENGEAIPFYRDGTSRRDYTYIDDIVGGIIGAIRDRGQSFEVFNLGNSSPVQLDYLIQVIEKSLGKKAKIKRLPEQPGDVPETYADIKKAEKLLGYKPEVPIEEGIENFVRWHRQSASSLAPSLI
jgi:UDP-glucuronate 4-epimerase